MQMLYVEAQREVIENQSLQLLQWLDQPTWQVEKKNVRVFQTLRSIGLIRLLEWLISSGKISTQYQLEIVISRGALGTNQYIEMN